ncbi:MAG TPA: DUF885 family protein, partial [Sphingomicrobium sp.]
MRTLLALAIGVAAVTSPAMAAPAAAAVPAKEDARFEAFANRVVDDLLRLDPVNATQIGEHRYDAQFPDVSAAGRAARHAVVQKDLTELGGFDRSRLSREHQVDAILLRDQLDYMLFSLDRLQDWAWDPLTYASSAGNGFFTLTSREFAPLPERLRLATGR